MAYIHIEFRSVIKDNKIKALPGKGKSLSSSY